MSGAQVNISEVHPGTKADRLAQRLLRYILTDEAYRQLLIATEGAPVSHWRDTLQPYFPHVNFNHLVIADLIRIPLQMVWLICIRAPMTEQGSHRTGWRKWGALLRFSSRQNSKPLPPKLKNFSNKLTQTRVLNNVLFRVLFGVMTILLLWLSVTTPFSLEAQVIFVVMLCLVAMLVRTYEGRLSGLMLIMLSAIATSRYLWWRYSSTLNWDNTLDWTFGLGLLFAESYACIIMFLGYFQTIWPLKRSVATLPERHEDWPTVDLYIPTYNEPLEVVKVAVFSSMAIDWPKDKLKIYLLDDGNREAFKQFAQSCGIEYLAREGNKDAKAGNLNHALSKTTGDYIAIFDCDHIPTRSFLQVTMGWFLRDDKLALIQTPHHFYSADPFERNLNNFRKNPNENELFYGLSQEGNDLWNAVFFCGSCAVLRREPLEEIGGIAVETVTEDAHTSLKLHRLGYNSIYLKVPQAAGLATESLSAHIGQRLRWARGMTQIFRTDNPMIGKGLSLGQRLCYSNAMLHFLYGLPRIIFLTAPLAFLLFQAHIIYASAFMIAAYALPHLLHSGIANSRLQGDYRRSFWAELYETVLAWYIFWPTTMALVNPRHGRFNVTVKGGLNERRYFDWSSSKPYILLVLLNLIGFLFGLAYLVMGVNLESETIILNMIWTLFNLTILGGAIAVSEEARQIRKTHRIAIRIPAIIEMDQGTLHQCEVADYSQSGLGLYMPESLPVVEGDALHIILSLGQHEHRFPAKVVTSGKHRMGIRFDEMPVEQEKKLIQCTFARADAWLKWNEGRESDTPIKSLMEIVSIGFRGYGILIHHSFPFFERGYRLLSKIARFFIALLPRQPDRVGAHHHVKIQ